MEGFWLVRTSGHARQEPAGLPLEGFDLTLRGRSKTAHQGGSVFRNDRLTPSQLLFARTDVFAHDQFQVVYIVEVDIGQILHVRLNVPGDSDIDQEQWPVAAH